jgi:hypothetical protein
MVVVLSRGVKSTRPPNEKAGTLSTLNSTAFQRDSLPSGAMSELTALLRVRINVGLMLLRRRPVDPHTRWTCAGHNGRSQLRPPAMSAPHVPAPARTRPLTQTKPGRPGFLSLPQRACVRWASVFVVRAPFGLPYTTTSPENKTRQRRFLRPAARSCLLSTRPDNAHSSATVDHDWLLSRLIKVSAGSSASAARSERPARSAAARAEPAGPELGEQFVSRAFELPELARRITSAPNAASAHPGMRNGHASGALARPSLVSRDYP